MLNLPFKCPFQFIMFEETIDEELDKRFKLKTQLLELGLKAVPITIDELYMAQTILNNHTNLSNYDAVSLSIAKVRNIPLLTGDLNLRKAAENEGVLVVGTI